MAYVTIRAVPFAPGADTLSPEVAAEVATFAAGLASDCFLTAQAIGHVEPGAAGEGDTLAAHRLARARAERVQKALAEKGLPANAVAGVWDWQFLVREPRVTLWVFSMREGED
jgi:outer membrane protein OmpA-like peptidoglycan-associated protein